MRESFSSRYALLVARSLRESAEARVRAAESARLGRGIRVWLARRMLAHRQELVAVLETELDPRIELAARQRRKRHERLAHLSVVPFVLSLLLLVLALARSGTTSGWTGSADTAMIATAALASLAYALAGRRSEAAEPGPFRQSNSRRVDGNPSSREASEMLEPPAYRMRMRFRDPDVAQALGRELSRRGADVELDGAEVTTVWPASDADDVSRWSDKYFPELLFFVRSWAGADPDRAFQVVEEGPLAVLR